MRLIRKTIFGLPLIAFLFISCNSYPTETVRSPTLETLMPKITETILQSPTLSRTPTKTTLPSPIPTTTATITPLPPLTTNGPYLAYFTKQGQSLSIVLLNPNGNGRRIIPIPNEDLISDLEPDISPDGKWLVFYTGSINEPPYDLKLNLLNLQDGGVQQVSKLILPDFPNNLLPIAESMALHNQDPKIPRSDTSDYWISELRYVFDEGIRSHAWSPDGRYLAFAGQIDGPSSDLYVYELASGAVRRMTNDLENVDSVFWSPDGSWILMSNSIPFETVDYDILYRIKPDTGDIKNITPIGDKFHWMIEGWKSKHELFILNGFDGGGKTNLRLLNIITGDITPIWPGFFWQHSYNSADQLLAINSVDSSTQNNLHLVSIDGSWGKTIIEPRISYIYTHRGKDSSFIAILDSNMAIIRKNGELTNLQGMEMISDNRDLSFSPDDRWYLISSGKNYLLFGETDQLVHTFSNIDGALLWAPNSGGLYTYNHNQIYYAPIPDGDMKLIYACPPEECWIGSITWVP